MCVYICIYIHIYLYIYIYIYTRGTILAPPPPKRPAFMRRHALCEAPSAVFDPTHQFGVRVGAWGLTPNLQTLVRPHLLRPPV